MIPAERSARLLRNMIAKIGCTETFFSKFMYDEGLDTEDLATALRYYSGESAEGELSE